MITGKSYHLSRHRPGPPAFPGCQQLACHVPATTQTVDGWSRHGQVAATCREAYYFRWGSMPTNPGRSHFQGEALGKPSRELGKLMIKSEWSRATTWWLS